MKNCKTRSEHYHYWPDLRAIIIVSGIIIIIIIVSGIIIIIIIVITS